MMTNSKYILLLFTLLVFISCEKDEIEGPSLNDLYADLTITEPLRVVGDNADFGNNNRMHFTASFSKQVDWKLEITGSSSGSVKIITGKSNTIDQSNSEWEGSSSFLPFFVAEECSVELTFEMHQDTINSQLTIQSPKQYNNDNTVLITDFEGGFNPNFTNFFQSGCTKALSTGGSGEGAKHLQQFGTCDWDWLIGYVDYFADFWFDQNTLINDPSRVYFNIMINGDSTISDVAGVPNSLFKLEFYEDEDGDGYYDANSEDRYDYEFDVDWKGWRMVSICYNDSEKLILTGNGDGVRNPSKVSNVRTLLLANPESGFAKADVDFLIWSIGAPILN